MRKILAIALCLLLLAVPAYAIVLGFSGPPVSTATDYSDGDCFVDPDASGAEDGSSWTDAYTSLADAEAQNLDITATGGATDDEYVIYCKSSSGTADEVADDSVFTWDGWVTDSTHSITIKTHPDDRHNGVWSETKYRLVKASDSTSAADAVLYIDDPNLKVNGLQIGLFYSTASRNCFTVKAGNVTIKNNIFRSTASGGEVVRVKSDSSSFVHVINNIIDGSAVGSSWTTGISFTSATIENAAYNNTVYGHGDAEVGIEGYGTYCKNNIVQNTGGDAYTGTFKSSSNYNISDDTTDTEGTDDVNSASVVFADAANNDLHLDATDTTAIDNGLDLSSDALFSFDYDIDGDSRGTNWDIGADEYTE